MEKAQVEEQGGSSFGLARLASWVRNPNFH